MPKRSKPLVKRVVGSSKATLGSPTVSGVKDLTRKKVFLVGNLNPKCTQEKLETYIQNMGVRIMTIFKSRSKFKDNCYRVCINALDVETFCDSNRWPENVSLRNWIHKPKKTADIPPTDIQTNVVLSASRMPLPASESSDTADENMTVVETMETTNTLSWSDPLQTYAPFASLGDGVHQPLPSTLPPSEINLPRPEGSVQ
jgi:hypothetical protein